jgi:acetyl esterase/lipase
MKKLTLQVRVLCAIVYSAIRGRMAVSKHSSTTLTYATRDGLNLELDLYLPDQRTASTYPLIIWFHGGGWVVGSRKDIEKLAIDQVTRGYAVASVSYTLAESSEGTKTHWPVQCFEAKAAVRFLRANADRFQLDASRFVAWGMSAGGHMAAMLGCTNDNPLFEGDIGEHNDESSRVQAVAAWYPPTDFEQMPRQFEGILDFYNDDSPTTKLLGKRIDEAIEECRLASPLQLAGENSPPFHLVHGGRDMIVPASQSFLMQKRLQELDVPVELLYQPTYAHGDFRFNKGDIARSVEAFLDNQGEAARGNQA